MPLFLEQPQLPQYDGKTKGFVTVNGVVQLVHWVDHLMMIGLCTRRGSWKSSPHIGIDYSGLEYVGGIDMQGEIERRVFAAQPIATLIANGDAEIKKIVAESTLSGAITISIDYVNLRLDKNKVKGISN